MREIIDSLCFGQPLTRQASADLFARIVRGELSELQLCAVLVALKAKGETADEIAGAAEALVTGAVSFPTGDLAVADTCGTGGDGAGTVNLSTAAALVLAEAGVAVAKHGNRAVSSRCGSADLLERCGVQVDLAPEQARRCLDDLGICFLFAPRYHPGMRHAMPVRRGLGVRTVFNLLGPLVNPARPRWQVVGVYDPDLCVPLAETLGMLGCQAALVVHGSGIDEIGLHSETTAALWRGGQLETMVLSPEQVGFPIQPLELLSGGTAEDNARWLRGLLSGGGSQAHQQAVALNAGALLWIAGRAADLAQGAHSALEVLRSGRAVQRLERWAELSRAV